MPIIIAIAIAAALGGGAVLASGNALPGDALYDLKSRYVEELRDKFSFSAAAQAAWAAERAERRLEEAERLTVEGELKAEARQRLQERFMRLADLAEARLEELGKTRPDVAAEIGASFSAALEAHERILALLAVNGAEGAEKAEVVGLQEAVDVEGNEAAGVRARLEASLSVDAEPERARQAAEGRRGAAENKIREVRRKLSRTTARMDAESVAQADARLRLAEAGLSDGDRKLEADLPAEAFASYSIALRVAQEAQRLIEARAALRIDVGLGGVAEPEQLYAPMPVEGGGGETEAGAEAETEAENEAGAEAEARIDLDATLRAPLGRP